MPKLAPDDSAVGDVRRKLPVLGQAIAGALDQLTGARAPDFAFMLLVIDGKTGAITWTSNAEKAAMLAALSEFLSKQSH